MRAFFNKNGGILVVCIVILFFNSPVFLKLFIPAPLDAMVGLYHPFRDYYSGSNPNGLPFKNFLITDPVRQLIVWKYLAIEGLKNISLPLWNPYEMGGKPLIGNFQSGVFYPVNLLFFLFDFKTAWALFIVCSQLIGAFFMYLYLRTLGKSFSARVFGTLAFVFSGFLVAWYEWGSVAHAFLWLPLCLYLCERMETERKNSKIFFPKYGLLLGVGFAFSLFAGHPQTTLYLIILTFSYFLLVTKLPWKSKSITVVTSIAFFTSISFVQIYQGLIFMVNSLRGADQFYTNVEGWFVPYQNLVQFIAPDFFGNPSTLNYWGVFNYAEFVGYIGLPALVFVVFSLFGKLDRKQIFFGSSAVICLLFVTKNPLSEIPYSLSLPIISSMQPTRLIGIISFCLVVLAVYGFDKFVYLKKPKSIIYTLLIFTAIFTTLWFIVLANPFMQADVNLEVAKRNLILPLVLFIATACILLSYSYTFSIKKTSALRVFLLIGLILVSIFDLMRFAQKFTPFTPREYFYPETKVLSYLQNNIENYRVMSIDDRILAPNITTLYKMQNISGYDPLYLKNFAELIVASERGEPNITLPYGFNRIVSPKKYDSPIIDLLGVKYILSMNSISSPYLKEVYREGNTIIYENSKVFERAFFVATVLKEPDKNSVLRKLFTTDLRKNALVVSGDLKNDMVPLTQGRIVDYRYLPDGSSRLVTESVSDGFMVVSDSYYPLITAYIDGQKTTIYETDYALRGLYVPKGKHVVEFKMRLF